MRTMSSRSRLLVSGTAAVVLAAVLAACGGATVDGEAPEITASNPSSTAASPAPFAEERPEKPTGPVPPPPPQSPEPEPLPGEPDPPLAPEPEPAPPEPVPGAGDFAALMDRQGLALPEGVDPVGTAVEACGRFDGGQQMDEVSGWLGDHAQLDPEGQGFFLGTAVMTYCPGNFPKLG